jgi:parallel beta-helix repeat protein
LSVPAVYVFTSNLVISNSKISDNGNEGISIWSASPIITDNVIMNNQIGIYLYNASPTITGNRILQNASCGIKALNSSNPTIEENAIGDNGSAILLDPSSSGTYIQGNDLFGPNAGIFVFAGNLEGSVTWNSDSVYIIDYYYDQYTMHLNIKEGAALTIEPGVVVKFQGNACLYVNGTLIADGTPESQIVFTSLKDDSYGGDTNGDESSTVPGKNDWGGIIFGNTSTRSVLKHVVVKYGGQTWSFPLYVMMTAIQVGTSDLVISNSTISDNGNEGIRIWSSSPKITDNIITKNDTGIYLYNASPTITGNTIEGNRYGIYTMYSSGSTIYLNNFASIIQNIHSEDSVNTWHSPKKMTYIYNNINYTNSLGNYWDDYTGSDADGDGIGDTPYSRDGDSDNYPLMMPFENYEIIGEAPPEDHIPVSSFTYSPENPESGEEVTFDASSSNDPDGEIVSYEWDFGDGEKAEGQIVSHRLRGIPDEAATYTVILTVKDNAGQVGTDEKLINVTHLEKKAEVVVDDILGTGLSRIGSRVSYNWNEIENGKDVFKISRIESWSNYFVGVYVVSVENDSGVLWQKRLPAIPLDRTYYPENIYVQASDWLRVTSYGVTEKEMLGLVSIAAGLVGLPTMPPGDIPFFYGSDTIYFAPDYIDTSDFPAIDIEDTEILPFLMGRLCSPGELSVYDSHGRVTGLVKGQIKEEIPGSAYFDGNFIIASPLDDYSYKIVGTDKATYDFVVLSVGTEQLNAFGATDISTAPSVIHEYTVDWAALAKGQEGVTLDIDADGDGAFEQSITAGVMLRVPVSVVAYVEITVGRVAYDRRAGEFSVNVTVTNTSDTVIDSPVWLVIESISNTSVTLADSDGMTTDGKEYIDLSYFLGNEWLDPCESVSTRVYFNNPQRKQFTFGAGVRGMILPYE